MDDLVGFLVGLIIAIAVIVWLVTVALPFLIVYVLLPGAGLGFLGKQFHSQLKRVKLTEKSWSVLGIIGALAIFIAVLVVKALELHGLWTAPVAILLFLAVAIAVLALWMHVKTWPILSEGRVLQAELSSINVKIRQCDTRITRLAAAGRKFEDKIGSVLMKKEALEALVKELCTMDARTYSIKRREWEQEISSFGSDSLAAKKQQYLRCAKSGNTDQDDRVESAIKAALTGMEELERPIGTDREEHEANTVQLEEARQEHVYLELRAAALQAMIEKNSLDYREITAPRIILN